ncbi:amylo-alpha-1,6-glucosidase [Pseudonocardia nigra]|uniref:amylo-alpha-1,6-glucosidase n=1 Tax=Pseudonocardia nigra TaxID=1921578 RepID=UPI001FE7A30A|nr:glycogen debranching N-terminal domain-containing protein [Pseudonocardia nigra]
MSRVRTPQVNLRTRPEALFAYSGRSLLVTDVHGALTGNQSEGFWFENTRLLSRWEVRSDGQPVTGFCASPVDRHTHLAYLRLPPGPDVPEQGAYLQVAHFLDEGLRTRIRLLNYSTQPVRAQLVLLLDADFADTQEADSGSRQQQGEVEWTVSPEGRSACLRYLHPDLDRAVELELVEGPTDASFSNRQLTIPLWAQPQATAELVLTAQPLVDGRPRRLPPAVFTPDTATSPTGKVRDQLRAETPRLLTTNPTVASAWRTAVDDLATTALGSTHGPAMPAAGYPLYQYLFGRDSLTTAWQAAMAMPSMLRDALVENAAWQTEGIDDLHDAEPGKLLHQARTGPISALGLDPMLAYYGDYATPVDFLVFLGQYLAWTGDTSTVRQLLPAARGALTWLERYGDADGDQFLEYDTKSAQGVPHQGWKDAPDSIADADGNLLGPPLATCELQGYYYAALRHAAVVFAMLGDRGLAAVLTQRARRLRAAFDEAFWMPEEGTYALALDQRKRQVTSVTSNPGHLLVTGIVPNAKAKLVADRLLAEDMFSGWGIRTLSSANPGYDPFSYHRGSVWPVENGTFALGMARYGLTSHLHRLAEAVFDTTGLFEDFRLPEAVGGLPRDTDHPHPGIYPDSNAPQAWSASTIVMIVQALLAARPAAPARMLLIDPHLPDWLPDLRLDGLRVGAASIDLELDRHRGRTRCRITGKNGRLAVVRQPPAQSQQTSPTHRATTFLRSPW